VEVGPQLVEARQRRGLTLNDISKSTKIPLSLLRAIECDDAARLPPRQTVC
jgi:cytoskeletal protein RodZ